MAKKKKKRGRAKKARLKIFSFALVLASGLGFSLGLVYYYARSGTTPPYPAYEEVYSNTSNLHRQMGRIDRAIFEILYRKGIPEEDIAFLRVRPRHNGGSDWDLSEMEIRLKAKSSVSRLSRDLGEVLSEFEPTVTIEKKAVSDNEIHCHVFALGFNTHRIRLVCKTERRPSKKKSFKLAIIVDDLGYDAEIGRDFMSLDLPLSLSFLPLAPKTVVMLKGVDQRRHEIMLHLPMEPNHWPDLNPGPGALMTRMGQNEIRETMERHLRKVTGARGINNHMGSYFTQRRDKMRIVLDEIKKRKLFFVDSRTTSRTVALDVARQMGVPATERSAFLDNEPSSKAIQFQLERLLGIARHSGSGVGICHPNKRALSVLKKNLPRLKRDFRMVHVSRLTQ